MASYWGNGKRYWSQYYRSISENQRTSTGRIVESAGKHPFQAIVILVAQWLTKSETTSLEPNQRKNKQPPGMTQHLKITSFGPENDKTLDVGRIFGVVPSWSEQVSHAFFHVTKWVRRDDKSDILHLDSLSPDFPNSRTTPTSVWSCFTTWRTKERSNEAGANPANPEQPEGF